MKRLHLTRTTQSWQLEIVWALIVNNVLVETRRRDGAIVVVRRVTRRVDHQSYISLTQIFHRRRAHQGARAARRFRHLSITTHDRSKSYQRVRRRRYPIPHGIRNPSVDEASSLLFRSTAMYQAMSVSTGRLLGRLEKASPFILGSTTAWSVTSVSSGRLPHIHGHRFIGRHSPQVHSTEIRKGL